jgi:undecaprenyl-diphosphatase
VNALIRFVADYALFIVALGAVVSWLRTPRQEKVPYAAAVVIAVVLVAVAIRGLGALWVDPRPFVVDHTTPLIAHNADNGFPSDHTALATAIAAVVFAWHRRVGAALLVVALLLGASRVAAHVHHVPDIVAGIAIGLVAAAIGVLVARRIPWERMSWARSAAGLDRQPAA